MTDYTERAREWLPCVTHDGSVDDLTVKDLTTILEAVAAEAREEQKEEDAMVCERRALHSALSAELSAMSGASYAEGIASAKCDAAKHCAAAIRAGGEE